MPRNEDDVILIDGLSDLLTKRRPKHRGSMPVSRDVEDGTDLDEAELMDAVSGLLATASINRRARHKGSVAVQRNEDDMMLIDAVSGLVMNKKPGPRRGKGSVAVRPDALDLFGQGDDDTLATMAALVQQRQHNRRGRGSVAVTPDANDDLVNQMSSLIANMRAGNSGSRGSIPQSPRTPRSPRVRRDDEGMPFCGSNPVFAGLWSDACEPRVGADAMLDTMSGLCSQLWTRSKMSITMTREDDELGRAMSTLIAKRRATMQQERKLSAVIREDDETLLMMMTELIETAEVRRKRSLTSPGSPRAKPDEDEELLGAMGSLIGKLWEKKHKYSIAVARDEDDDLLGA